MYAPFALVINMGVPPTLLKARTGELTPPGMLRWARAKSSWLFEIEVVIEKEENSISPLPID
jgi:hypothetical protein